MRVVHVDTAAELRGGQTQLLALLQGRRDLSDVEDHVVVRPDAPLRPALEAAGIEVHTIPFRGILRGGRRLGALIASLQPDLVAAHTPHAHTQALAFGKAPLVVHRRVDFVPRRDPLTRLQYSRVRGFVAVSEAVAGVLRGAGVRGERIAVVHDGVDPARVASTATRDEVRRALDIPADALLVGSVGALVAHKGHEHLVDALAWIDNDRQDVWGVLIGEGPERARLEARIERWGIAERTRLIGHRDDVADLLRALDVLCHPSVEEGLGQAVIEAMLAGIPVVASSTGGLREVIDDLETGLLVAPGDGAPLSRALLAALRGRDRTLLRAERARQVARERFGVERMVRETTEAYLDFVTVER